jgi:hypothetical protein
MISEIASAIAAHLNPSAIVRWGGRLLYSQGMSLIEERHDRNTMNYPTCRGVPAKPTHRSGFEIARLNANNGDGTTPSVRS